MSKEKPIYLNLATAAEELAGPAPEPLKAGRIKHFFRMFRENTKSFYFAILFTAVFAVPLAVLFYWLLPNSVSDIASGYNFMGQIGIGYPGISSSIAEGQIAVYNAYQMVIYYMAPAAFILSVPFAGLNHLAHKAIRGEKIEKSVKEFFIGIKRNWLNTAIIMAIGIGLLLGGAVLILTHLKAVAAGTATAGSWVMFVFVIILEIPYLILSMFMLPMSAAYKLSFPKLLKNSAILALKLVLPAIIVGIVSLVPIILIFAISSLSMFITVFYMLVGFVLTALGWMEFGTYAYDNIMNPVHELNQATAKKSKDGGAPQNQPQEKGAKDSKNSKNAKRPAEKAAKDSRAEAKGKKEPKREENVVSAAEEQESTAKESTGDAASQAASKKKQTEYVNPKKKYKTQNREKKQEKSKTE